MTGTDVIQRVDHFPPESLTRISRLLTSCQDPVMKATILLVLSLSSFAACSSQKSESSSIESSRTTATLTMTQEFIDLLNQHRETLNLQPLVLDLELSEIAQNHSDAMADRTVPFGHDGFSARCSEARKVLGGGNQCAENVAQGQRDPKDVFKAWMNSPGHRSHIEDGRLTHTGFAFKKDSSGSLYWTEIFIEYK